MTRVVGVAVRISAKEAELIFDDGATIAVSDRAEDTFVITPATAVHNNRTYATFAGLRDEIEQSRAICPNMHYYFIDYQLFDD